MNHSAPLREALSAAFLGSAPAAEYVASTRGDHFSSGAWGGCRSAHIARGGDFNGPSVRHGRIASNNWNVKWNANWDHHHHHHFNNRFFFTSGPFFYGDYYAYGYGNCAWLRRQAIITGSPYYGAVESRV